MSSCFNLSESSASIDQTEKEIVYATFGASPLDIQEERKYSLMEREIEYIMEIWPGEYDNVEQLSLEKDAGRKEQSSGQHARIHSKVTRVTNEALGEYVLYLEEAKNNSEQIHAQQVYVLKPMDSIKSIAIEIYHIKDGNSFFGSEDATDQITKLERTSFTKSKHCSIILQREGYSFFGRSSQQLCSTDSKNSKDSYQIRLSKNDYWFRYLEDINDATTGEGWYMLSKARCFICMVDFPREEGGRPVDTRYYVDMHDQGGQFEFDYTDGRHMVLTMRNTWSYGMQRNTFVIVIQEGSLDGPTLIYSWGADGADRIGMNPGWIRIQCDLKNDKNVLLQQKLRPDS